MPLKTLGPIGPRAVGERVKARSFGRAWYFQFMITNSARLDITLGKGGKQKQNK